MSIKITEERYTRGYIAVFATYTVSVILAVASGILGVVESPGSLAMSTLFLFGSVLFFTMASAFSHRGLWNKIYSGVMDVGWVLDDVDADDLVDGPVVIDE
jgi:hypothetical protein